MNRMAIITSHSNPRIKELKTLRRRKGREASGLCVVEGMFHIGEALAAHEAGNGTIVETICFTPERTAAGFGLEVIERATRLGIPTYAVADEVLASAAGKDNPQGILAVVRPRQTSLTDLSPTDTPWLVALVSPQDPGNVGAILRTIDAVGASGLLLLENSVDPYHPTALRASMGAIFWLPVVMADFERFAAWSQRYDYRIYGTSAGGQVDYRSAQIETPLILLMGSEREGLTPNQASICRQLLRLPMQGRVSSLNLAVATGVFLYQLREILASPTNL